MFYKLLLRLLLLAKKEERILAAIGNEDEVYYLSVTKYDLNWIKKLEQQGKEVFGEDFTFDCEEETPETEKAS